MLTLNVTASVPQESRKCAIIRFANPGWSDVTVTTAAAAYVLQTLGYKTKEVFISVPITYLSLAAGDVDVFLGYWDPSMNQIYKPYAENKTVEILHTNLTGANYGLAVPKYLYDAGLTDIKDLAKFSHLLNNKIYGIEPGNDGNQIILSIINDKKFNINNFQLIESSEQAMLSQADLLISQKQPIVFLAWEPHPMNIRYDIKYLTGAENYFGFNKGQLTYTQMQEKISQQNVLM
ncbi:glycine betaine ABC transporter substrate-binding protein [Bartonella sp. DGB1]|uniref:glycine betaine ABC transporter substrate-binding protein n=1 Tax=Bartonella sp. DGB1 TaxID=3239807 RepID=UPI003526A2DE